ncbi:MAG: alpha/beta fold hydrolase [Cyclobacteriaceae bacterium]
MPVLKKSSYSNRPWFLPNRHLETIVPSVFFKTDGVSYTRERLELEDGDFLDLDWIRNGNSKLLILSHGLEGNSDRQYIRRSAKFFRDQGYDVLAWNCRGCSGEINRLRKSYQHGDVDDIGAVIAKALDQAYSHIHLVAYSMGGNMTLKYLGVKGNDLDSRVRSAATFSVPCHLQDSSAEINKKENRFYEKRFIRKLKAKMELKAENFPDLKYDWSEIKDFHDFNLKYTIPVYGFESEQAFFDQARSDLHLPNISIPTLVANAKNDPMLGEKNYPIEYANQAEHVFLEMPERGGHVGFTIRGDQYSWMEYRALEFFENPTAKVS